MAIIFVKRTDEFGEYDALICNKCDQLASTVVERFSDWKGECIEVWECSNGHVTEVATGEY